jgi:Phage tail assembly chaperone protein, TAC
MKQEKKVINGVTYKVTTMDAFSALSVQSKLVRLLGGSFSELTSGADKDSISKAITKLTESMDDTNVVSLVTKLFEKNIFYVEIMNGQEVDKPIDFSSYFSGKTADMWLVAMFIIQTNFSDVLGKLGLNSIFQEVEQKIES